MEIAWVDMVADKGKVTLYFLPCLGQTYWKKTGEMSNARTEPQKVCDHHWWQTSCVFKTVTSMVDYSVSGRKRKSEEATGETTDKKLKLEVNHYITMMLSWLHRGWVLPSCRTLQKTLYQEYQNFHNWVNFFIIHSVLYLWNNYIQTMRNTVPNSGSGV